jgi:hypothetical protein
MSILFLKARPIITFDAKNPTHRKYYLDFVKHRTWGYCPVRFMTEDGTTDLVTHVNRKMLDYYVQKEFKGRRASPKTVKFSKTKE